MRPPPARAAAAYHAFRTLPSNPHLVVRPLRAVVTAQSRRRVKPPDSQCLNSGRPQATRMADKIEIVRLDAEGNVKETLHDDFPAGWSAARTEFIKLRHGYHGTAAGGWLELRVGGVAKMSTKRK